MITRFLPFALPCLLLASAQAQSFNLNFTGSPTIGPPTSYAGAAGQPGKWHSIDLQTTTPKPIKVLNGQYAGCLSILPSQPLSTFTWPDTHTCGTIEDLLDSCAQVDPTGADIVISGVTPGSYPRVGLRSPPHQLLVSVSASRLDHQDLGQRERHE